MLVVEYGFAQHTKPTACLPGGSTVIWPYFCGNLFPCHSQPADGTTFTLDARRRAGGKTAVYPDDDRRRGAAVHARVGDRRVHRERPRHDDRRHAGQRRTGCRAARRRRATGTKHLVAAFDWFEKTSARTRSAARSRRSRSCGARACTAAWSTIRSGTSRRTRWATRSRTSTRPRTAGSATASACAAGKTSCCPKARSATSRRARSAGRGAGGRGGAVWAEYQDELDDAIAEGGAPAWPTGCNQIDILKDNLFTNLPYMQGAFFYKDVAAQVGADKLDQVLADFYATHTTAPPACRT